MYPPYQDPNQPNPQQYQQPTQPYIVPGAPGPMFIDPPTAPMAIASFVLGIAGLVILPIIGPLLAIIFGHMARNEIKVKAGQFKGDGFALAGLIMGYIGIALAVLLIIFIIVIVIVAVNSPHTLQPSQYP